MDPTGDRSVAPDQEIAELMEERARAEQAAELARIRAEEVRLRLALRAMSRTT